MEHSWEYKPDIEGSTGGVLDILKLGCDDFGIDYDGDWVVFFFVFPGVDHIKDEEKSSVDASLYKR